MHSVLERIERAARPPLHTLAPREARIAYEAGAQTLESTPGRVAHIRDFTLPSRRGAALHARLYRAERADAAASPVLLYLHGGGLVIGSIATHDLLCRDLCSRSESCIVSLDYRLAPEHRFPAAFDDACDALAWLHVNAASIGCDAARVAIGGDSAGGALAASAAIWARDQRLPLSMQLLITPHAAAEPTASRRAFAHGFLLDATTIDWFFDLAVPRESRADWRFAPLHADDLDGVAPACVILAECDPLVDEGLAYADRLRAAGVAVTLDLVRGVTHEFIRMGRAFPEADAAREFAITALGDAWNRA
jgi:acetyl esterase